MGPAATSAIPALIEALKDDESNLRGDAALALGAIGHQPSVVVPALVARLSDSDPRVRGHCVGALFSFGKEAKAAVPALEDALHDINGNVRSLAAIALEKIKPLRETNTQEWNTSPNPSRK